MWFILRFLDQSNYYVLLFSKVSIFITQSIYRTLSYDINRSFSDQIALILLLHHINSHIAYCLIIFRFAMTFPCFIYEFHNLRSTRFLIDYIGLFCIFAHAYVNEIARSFNYLISNLCMKHESESEDNEMGLCNSIINVNEWKLYSWQLWQRMTFEFYSNRALIIISMILNFCNFHICIEILSKIKDMVLIYIRKPLFQSI